MVVTRNTDTRLEGLEKVTSDLDTKTTTLTSMVDELKIQCTTTDARMTTIASQLESFMVEFRAAMATGFTSKTPETPPIGNPPIGNPPIGNPPATNTASGANPPLTIPSFDGTDAIAWLARAEQYFLVSNIPRENRLGVTMVALAGPALPWFLLLQRRLPTLDWDRFKSELMKRFGDKMALDGYEAFASTRQDGSLVDFVAAFEARLAQIPDLSDHQYLGFFLAALRPEVRMHMKAANITSYSDAVQMALQLDQLNGTHPASPAPASPAQAAARPSPKAFTPSPPSFPASGSSRPPTRRFRNISTEEYKRHIAAGTCFRCGLKFGPAHRCPPKTLNVFVADDDDSITDDPFTEDYVEDVSGVELKLSELSCNGLDTSYTMKIIRGHRWAANLDHGR